MDFKRSLLCFFIFLSPISCYRNQGGPIFINRNSSALILPFSPPISSWSPPASDAISQLLHPEARIFQPGTMSRALDGILQPEVIVVHVAQNAVAFLASCLAWYHHQCPPDFNEYSTENI